MTVWNRGDQIAARGRSFLRPANSLVKIVCNKNRARNADFTFSNNNNSNLGQLNTQKITFLQPSRFYNEAGIVKTLRTPGLKDSNLNITS